MTISHTCYIHSSLIELNKFKKRRYHTLKNLLTGTTEVQPDLVRVSYREFTRTSVGGGVMGVCDYQWSATFMNSCFAI